VEIEAGMPPELQQVLAALNMPGVNLERDD
jgi:hypothetical protein